MTSNDIAALVVFCAFPLILLILVGIAIRLFYIYRRNKNQHAADSKALEEEIELFKEEIEILKKQYKRLEMDEWFSSLSNTIYMNETEVEIKFVYPLVKFLGYADNDIRVRAPVSIKLGREDKQVQADWVLYKQVLDKSLPFAIIEAKTAGHSLNREVQLQARSYAYGLDVALYAVTNGTEFILYKRNIGQDSCVVNCTVQNISDFWAEIEEALGSSASVTYSHSES